MAQDISILYVGVIILIAILVLPSVFGQPTIFENLLNLGRDLFEDLRDTFFQDWGTGGGSQTELGWFVEYDDGTKQEWNPNQTFPLTVLHEGKAIRYFGVTTWYKLDSSREISHIEGSVYVVMYLDDVAYQESTQPFQFSTPPLGEWTKIPAGGISFGAERIEELDQGQFETHVVKGTTSVTLTARFGDGTSVELNGNAEGSMTLEVVETATLNVEVHPVTVSIFPSPLS